MHVMGLVEELLEEEVMGLWGLSSRLVHLNRLWLLSYMVGHILTSQETISSLLLTEIHIHHLLMGLRERTWHLGLILLCLALLQVLFLLMEMAA